MAGETLESLRAKYLAVGCMISVGSRLAGRYEGNRVFFVAACNGENVVVYDVLGVKTEARRADFVLQHVYDPQGRPVRFEIDEDTGHLQVFKGTTTDETGAEVEIWTDRLPWTKYDAEFDMEVQAAAKGIAPVVDQELDTEMEMEI